MTSLSAIEKELVLDGVVTYILGRDKSGRAIIDARWVSSRTTSTNQTGTGRAIRRGADHENDDAVKESAPSFEGDWRIQYFGPDGQLAVTPFLLNLKKNNQIYHGTWSLPNGDPVLHGFGFEHGGSLVMRYGSPRQ
ncbi:uncharacterized protein FPRO_12423 [Fusarium proliferatum ET1]|uniref:Uncharacterized protein n=1 Tax=Fusarium proliferatum (strain ET1) TaxID=1227346 RepID=A0A1L7W8U9_FUSPR|nr:uncharacterized protein FPRO_12423 [Fusarium proliferatum ET1]CZR48983.1 uncharacterized protein FPRO_12423 [Fusarium proliferatum ET1]